MKIFLTGGSGLLGSSFVSQMTERDLSFVAPTSETLDLLDFPAVRQFIATEKPDLIIHCAAYTAVDKAETDHLACWELNVLVLENLLSLELPIVHFSTDYIFNTDQQPIPVQTPRDPLNYYGESKAAAEVLLEVSDSDWWNVRTTWLYGENGEGFPQKIKARAASGEAVQVVNDQFGRKTLNTDLVGFILDNLSPGSVEPGLTLQTGHHHYQSPGPVHSWYDWAQEILADWEGEIVPISADELNLSAVRPQNSVLI